MNKDYNLLFIFTDEQAAKTMKAYGNNIIETPNLDRLADESIVFENTYVTQPVCTPSRSSLLTGLYPHTNGCIKNNIPLPRETPCLPEMGDFEDYKTAYYGKWHLGDEIFAQHGFKEWKSIEDGYYKYYSNEEDKNKSSSYSEYLMEQGFRPEKFNEYGLKGFSRIFSARLPEKYSKPAYLAREAAKFIDENKEEPFMLFVNFLEPHMPYFGPRDNQYDPEEIPLPENFNHELTKDVPLKVRIYREAYKKIGHSGLPLKTEADWKRLIANYWGLVSQVDTYVGEILDQLKESGQYDNTIIVFTSDHGDMMGAHRLLAKCTMFEEAVKVPLLLKIPGLTSRRITAPVSQIDLVPTLLDAMGQNIPSHLEGFSWMNYLKQEGDLKEEDVFIEWNGDNTGMTIPDELRELYGDDEIESAITDPLRTVITPEGWKYNRSCNRNEDELYDLNEDPYEMNNLAQDNKYQSIISKLSQKIDHWQQRTDDK